MEALRPVRQSLLPGLQAVFRDRERDDSERSLATSILADYAADQPRVLADLLMDADEKQFAVIFPKLKDARGARHAGPAGEIDRTLPRRRRRTTPRRSWPGGRRMRRWPS